MKGTTLARRTKGSREPFFRCNVYDWFAGKAWYKMSVADFEISRTSPVRQTGKDVCKKVQRKEALQKNIYRVDNRAASGFCHFNG